MPLDYPRINQFPEWFTVEESNSYTLNGISNKISGQYSGEDLIKGIELEIDKGKIYAFELIIN